MLAADTGAALSTVCVFWVMFGGVNRPVTSTEEELGVRTAVVSGSVGVLISVWSQLKVWVIYVGNAVSSALNAFHWPAFIASTTLLVRT